ncbi:MULTISPECIES: MarR family winged helix-turn-helix transcriptional regulator [unclassified Paenibacillus]|uniref:MarR family winged helix-turn-helix transcriptional regulator n=1 Tax=unclassified Paenibacillus TaxID=185978 RepID=UPI0008CCFAA9|nr:MarR family transcriptional regulator [Paenibacillus sp. OK076]SEN15694.1 transcriptional regulator, MarR family [Paenibacillus sp. OK076]
MNNNDWEVLEKTDWLFRKMVRRFVKERDRISVEGVSLPGMLILHKIIREGEQRLGDLAEQLDFTSGAITALTDKLEKKGLTIRRRKEDDRRTVLLDITASGREMFARNSNIGARCITLLFEGFTTEELEQQSQFYERVIANLEGFSDTLLELAESNGRQEHDPSTESDPEQKQRENTGKSNYLSY